MLSCQTCRPLHLLLPRETLPPTLHRTHTLSWRALTVLMPFSNTMPRPARHSLAEAGIASGSLLATSFIPESVGNFFLLHHSTAT